MGILGNPANLVGTDAILPRPGATDYRQPVSYERMNQAAAVAGAGLNAALGKGIVSGGLVSDAGGLNVTLADETILLVGGVAFQLDGDLGTALIDDADNILWATVKRTEADASVRSNLDTYVAAIYATDTGDPPDTVTGAPPETWFPVAAMTTASGAISGDIDNSPPGKYLAYLAPGVLSIPMPDTDRALTDAEALNRYIVLTGTLPAATRDLVVPLEARRGWVVANQTDEAVQVIGATGTGITIATGKTAEVFTDGVNVLRASADV